MREFRFGISPPCEPDKRLNRTYENLQSELTAQAQKRAAFAKTYQEKRDRSTQLAERAYRFSDSQADVECAAIDCELLESEVALLETELNLANRSLEYLNDAIKSRQHAIAVADEMIPLAEQKVREQFEKQYPPRNWKIGQGALERLINEHPIVVGARVYLDEVKNNHEAESIRNTQMARRQIADYLRNLQNAVPMARQRVEKTKENAERVAESMAQQSAVVQAKEQERLAYRQAVLEEAKSRAAV